MHRCASIYSASCLGLIGLLIITDQCSAGLVSWWPLSDGSGTLARDHGPAAVDGIVNDGMPARGDSGGLGPGGSVWLTDPVRGNVISFDGAATGAYVRVGNIPVMTLEQNFTWTFWGNQDVENTSPNDIIFGNRRDENNADFVPRQFIKFTPTKFEFHMNGNGNDNLEYDDIPGGEWIHHAVAKDGANVTYYRNGVEASTGAITQPLDFVQPLFLGGDNTGRAGENWRGMLSQVAIFDHPLSAAEVVDVMNGNIDPGVPGDVNGDMVTNLDDFNIISMNFRRFVQSREEGDLNRDGIVDPTDFRLWKNGSEAPPPGAASVPEPASIILPLSVLFVLLAMRWKQCLESS